MKVVSTHHGAVNALRIDFREWRVKKMGIAKATSKKLKDKADERYLAGHPTRMEVANYVNALLEERYLPHIQSLIQMSSMVLQAILIKKNICTGEELKEVTEDFVKEHEKRMNALNNIGSGELLREVTSPSYLETLNQHAKKVMDGQFSFQDERIQNEFAIHLSKAADMLTHIVKDSYVISDDEREAILKDLTEDKRAIESGDVKLNDPEQKALLVGVLWDAILPFAHKKLSHLDKIESDTTTVPTEQ